MQRLGAAERSTGSVAHVSRAPLAAFLTCAPLSPSVVCLSARIVCLLIEEREKSLCTAQRVFPAIRAHRYVEGSDKSNRKDTCSSVVAQASAPMSCTQPDKKKFHRAHCITHEENTTKAWTKRLRPCGGERAGSRCRDDTMLFSKALLLLFESHAYSRKRVALWLPAKVRLGGHRDGRGREAGFASALCFLSAETAIVLHLSLREAFFKPRG